MLLRLVRLGHIGRASHLVVLRRICLRRGRLVIYVEVEAQHAHGSARRSVDRVLRRVHRRNLLAGMFVDGFNKRLTSFGSSYRLIGSNTQEIVLSDVARDGCTGAWQAQFVHLANLLGLETFHLLVHN